MIDNMSPEEQFLAVEAADRIRLENDFLYFAECAWKIVEPGVPLIKSTAWVTIGEHFQAVAEKQPGMNRLIINAPPRGGKSNEISIIGPAFLMARDPSVHIGFYSWALSTGESFAMKRRRLITSHWFQSRWPFKITQDRLDWMINDKGGDLHVYSDATGLGCSYLFIDDPLSGVEAASDLIRESRNAEVRSSLLTRINRPDDSIIVTAQRLHDEDLTGVLVQAGGWKVLSLPARVEDEPLTVEMPASEVSVTLPVGHITVPNHNDESLESLRDKMLGPSVYSAQYQQKPTPLAGHIVDPKSVQFYDPSTFDYSSLFEIVLSVDAAYSSRDAESSDVAIHCYGLIDGIGRLIYRNTKRRNYNETKVGIRDAIYHCNFLTGGDVSVTRILIECKAQGGPLIEDLSSPPDNLTCIPIIPTLDKGARLALASPMIEMGRILLPDNKDGHDIKRLLAKAPKCPMDDCDALSQFGNWLRGHASSMAYWVREGKKNLAKMNGSTDPNDPAVLAEVRKSTYEATFGRPWKGHNSDEHPSRGVIETECDVCGVELYQGQGGAKCLKCGKMFSFVKVLV